MTLKIKKIIRLISLSSLVLAVLNCVKQVEIVKVDSNKLVMADLGMNQGIGDDNIAVTLFKDSLPTSGAYQYVYPNWGKNTSVATVNVSYKNRGPDEVQEGAKIPAVQFTLAANAWTGGGFSISGSNLDEIYDEGVLAFKVRVEQDLQWDVYISVSDVVGTTTKLPLSFYMKKDTEWHELFIPLSKFDRFGPRWIESLGGAVLAPINWSNIMEVGIHTGPHEFNPVIYLADVRVLENARDEYMLHKIPAIEFDATNGISVGLYHNLNDPISKLDNVQGIIGKKLGLIGLSFTMDDLLDPPLDKIIEVLNRGYLPVIEIIPSSDEKGIKLDDILKGIYDKNLKAIKEIIDNHPNQSPVIFSLLPNPNVDWYYWTQINSSSDYINAYKHIHRILTSETMDRNLFAWSSYCLSKNDREISDYYPGDDVVDLIGLQCFVSKSEELKPMINQSYATLSSSYKQPLMLTKLCYEEDKDRAKAKKIDMLDLRQDFPNIKALLWYNGRTKDRDWRISSSYPSFRAFRRFLRSDYISSGTVGIAKMDTQPGKGE